MSMQSSYLQIGSDIYTSDGSKLGTVKEVEGTYFKVDAPMQPDYWLSSDCVRGGTGASNRVDLTFDKSELDTYKYTREND